MEEKLEKLYNECVLELNKIGIDVSNENVGKIFISISNKSNKRYGCCKQKKPNKDSIIILKKGNKKIIETERFENHYIEISDWVMKLNDKIIKNTIIHEIIHCIPGCNNHGSEFKKYASYINDMLGYNISRLGNKKEDFEKSGLKYEDEINYKYKIKCLGCGEIFYRNRIRKDLEEMYSCSKCGGNLKII